MLTNYKDDKNMQLDPNVANEMLSNIFTACEYEPNTVPLEVLTSYSNYRKERYLFQKIILGIVFVLFFLLPLLFVAPKFDLQQKEGDFPGKPYIEITVDNLIPVDKISASIDHRKVPVYETADGTYQAVPYTNGTLAITVELANNQYTTKSIEVSDVDTQSPTLLNSEHRDGYLVIYFSDDSGVLDYQSVYANTSDGSVLYPVSYDETKMSITFKYPSEYINIFVSDMSGNTLQVVVTLY